MHQQLLDQISELKLKGLKEAYLLQMQTPNYIHMPFEERLAHLIDAEIINRKNCRIKQYLRAAKLKYRNAFLEDIEYLANRNLERSQIATLAKNQWIERKHSAKYVLIVRIVRAARGLGLAPGLPVLRQQVS